MSSGVRAETPAITDPDKGQWATEAARSIAANTANDFTSGLEYLGRGLIGDTEGRQRAAGEYLQRQEEARTIGPRIQSFEDAEAAGGGVGDYAASLGYQAAQMVPDAAAALTGFGIGGAVARRGARKAVTSTIADSIENSVEGAAAREVAIKAATRRAALDTMGTGAKPVANAIRVARAQVDEVGRRAAMQEAVAITGRTPRLVAQIERAAAVGRTAGATAASIPGLNGSMNAEKAADASTSTGDMWTLAAGTTAAALTQSVPLERLRSQFGEAALKSITAQGRRFLPRVAAEFGKQGLAEGTQEVAQQALQLASHAYVEKNWGTLTGANGDGKFDGADIDGVMTAYLPSFVGGFVLGGAMGGAGEVGRTGARTIGPGYANAKEMIKDGLAKWGQRTENARKRKAGEPMDAEGTGVGDLKSWFDTTVSKVSGGLDAVGKAAATARDKFKDITSSHIRAQQLEGDADEVTAEMGDAIAIPGQLRQSSQNAFQYATPLEAYSMSFVDESKFQGDEAAAQRAAKALGALWKKEPISDADIRVQDVMVERGLISKSTMQAMRAMGSIASGRAKDVAKEYSGSSGGAMHTATGGRAFDDIDNEEGGARSLDIVADADGNEIESSNWDQGVSERDALPRSSLAERVANTARGAPEYADAVAALQRNLMGEITEKRRFGQNITHQPNKDGSPSNAPFLNGLKEVGRVEIDPVTLPGPRGIQARASLSVDSLVGRYIAELGPQFKTDDKGQEDLRRAAVMQVFADLKLAGINVKKNSIKPGTMRTKDGEYIATITPIMAKKIRGVFDKFEQGGPNFEPRTTAQLERKPNSAAYQDALDNELYEHETFQGEDEFANDDGKLLPRVAPEGSTLRTGAKPALRADGRGYEETKRTPRDMVSTEEQITNVTTNAPYEKVVNKVRRAREKDPTPSKVREAIHSAGVEIGLAELDRQKADDKISDKRYEREVDELLDYTSGASRRYFKKAVDGGFDTASFSERRTPRDDVDRAAAKEEREDDRDRRDVPTREAGTPSPKANTGATRFDDEVMKKERLGADITKSKVGFLGDEINAPEAIEAAEKHAAAERKEQLNAYRGVSHDIAKLMGVKFTDTMKAFWKVTTDADAKAKLITAIGKTRSAQSLLRIMAYTKRVMPDVFEAAVLRHLELRTFEHNGSYVSDNPTWQLETHEQAEDSWSLSGLLSMRKPKTVAEAAAVALTIPGGTDVQRKMLAAMAKSEVLKGVKFSLSIGPRSRAGVYDFLDHQVTIFDVAQQDFIATPQTVTMHDVMIHEFAHALTVRAELTDKTIARDLDALLVHVRKHMAEAGHPIDRIYGASTTQEFLAEAFSNPEMQRILAGIPALNTKTFQSAWDEFKSLVGKILSSITGMKLAPTALDEIITIGFAAGKKTKALKLNEIGANDLSTANAKHAITASAMAAAGPAQAERYTPNDIGSLISFVKYTLPKEERQILDSVFGRGVAVTTLREHFKAIPQAVAMLDDAKEGMEARIALGYLAWRAGAFKTGPKGQSSLTQVHDSLMRIFGVAGETDLAQRVLNDIASGRIEKLRRKSIKYSVRDLEARGRGTRQRALNWLQKEGPVSDAAAKFWTSTYARMRDSGIPAMRVLAATLQRPQGATGDEDRGFNPAARLQTMRFHQAYTKIWEGMDETERDHAMMTLQRQAKAGDPAYDKKSPKIRAAVDAMRALYYKAWLYGNDDAVRMWGDPDKKAGPKHRPNYTPVMMDMRDPDAAMKLGALYRKKNFREPIFDHFGIPSMERTKETLDRLVQKLVDAAVGGNVAQVEDGDGLISGTRAQNVRLSQFIYDHGTKEDIHAFAKLQTKNVDEVFARYFSPMAKAGEARRRFGGLEPVIDKKTGKPVIYKGGEKEGETVMKFNPRLKLDAMLEDAKRQGASKDDIALMENAVRAAMGTYGIDGSPTLKAISPALAERFGGPKTKSFVQGVQAYQNLRLLPLSLLSSLVDPMGIAVRTGGGFAETWHGVKQGLKSIGSKKDKAELIALLEDLGASDDFMPALAAHPVFEGQESAVARRINEAVFKWNGMNTWVMSTRIMAMEAGHRFLLKHAEGAAKGDETSQRYLAELSLEPGDIAADPNNPNRMVLNKKTRAALLQFVDEAILRPNSMQVPLWHRDPYMGLITQYKAFGYAMHDQIVGRIGREFNHGNYRVLLAAASYAPIALMAEMLRELVQYGLDGNPNRKDWSAPEYAMLAAERSGMLNPKVAVINDTAGDIKRSELPGSSQLGPTGGQVDNALEGFSGRRALDKEFEAALPASAAWRHWNDEVGAEAAA